MPIERANLKGLNQILIPLNWVFVTALITKTPHRPACLSTQKQTEPVSGFKTIEKVYHE
jgi:hypothetical protein